MKMIKAKKTKKCAIKRNLKFREYNKYNNV